MDMTDHEAEPHFSQPVRQIFLMLVALGLFSFGGYIALPRVAPVFLANPYLNGLIAAVFLAGVLACILQMVQLISSVRWIERFSGKNREDSKRKFEKAKFEQAPTVHAEQFFGWLDLLYRLCEFCSAFSGRSCGRAFAPLANQLAQFLA